MSLPRRLLQVAAFLCTLVVGVASMAVIVTQTAWFKDWLRGFIVGRADDYLNGRLSIGRLGGNLFFGVELDDVAVSMNGQTVVGIDNLAVDYNVFTLLGGTVALDGIQLVRPVLRLERTPEGWNLARLVKTRTPDPDEPRTGPAIEIERIAVRDGVLYIVGQPVGTSGVALPGRIEGLDAELGVISNERELLVDVARLSLQAREPELRIESLSGVVTRTADQVVIDALALRTERSALHVDGTIGGIESGTPTVDLSAASEALALEEIARLVPALQGFRLTPAFELTTSGPIDGLSVTLRAADERIGAVNGDVTVDALAPRRRVAGTVQVERLDYGPIVAGLQQRDDAAAPAPQQSDITGRARIDFVLPEDRHPLSGTYAVDASRVAVAGFEASGVVAEGRIDGDTIRVDARANAYGGHATATGAVRTGDELSLDLAGRATEVDLRNLPPEIGVPAVPSRLDVEYSVSGRGNTFTGDATFGASMLAGAAIAPGTVARFTVGDGPPRYGAAGEVSDLDLQQIGHAFGIEALTADRFRSRIAGRFDVSGSGGGQHPLSIEATGTLRDSEIFAAAIPQLDFAVSLAGGDARIEARGEFANLNPAELSGDERMAGALNGAVDLRATLEQYQFGVTADSLAASGVVMLRESNVAKVSITEAVVDGEYADRGGRIARLEVTGPDVNVRAEGPVSLADTGATNLTVHADTSALDHIGQIVGQPLKGTAALDAVVTGNGARFEAKGRLEGSNIGHGENEALSLTSDFVAQVPELALDRASVSARSMVTFLEIGGQRITELTADTTYSGSTLEFEATAQEGERELDAGGTVVFHPDHQEIHLVQLALRTEGVGWQMQPGSEATVQYGGGRIDIEGLALVNGDQRIAAEGVLGSDDEQLYVRVNNVDVADVDRLLLGDQRVGGRFNADARISGPFDALRAAGHFTLTDGSFRAYEFESLEGEVDYTGPGVTLDVRLQQSPTEWLTAKGFAPLTLFRPNPEGIAGHQEPEPGRAIDLRVESSEIGLGVVQGFTRAVTDVEGVLQANLTVTGSGYDPHIEGTVDVRGGSFAVPALGTDYTGLDTTIGLTPDGITIEQFKILDGSGSPMTVGGTLAMHAREVGAVNVRIESERFTVVDNDLADLALDTDIRVTGEIRRPRIEGAVEVEDGTIDVAALLASVTSNPYDTETSPPPDIAGIDALPPAKGSPPAKAPEAAAQAGANEQEAPSVFDALAVDLELKIPDNLVLRGTDVRAANAPISLGDMNVTAGGTLRIQKAPSEELRLVGDINTVRGTYTFQGRRFEILRDGRIRFTGTDEINPLLEVRARRVISGVETFVNVGGTMREPQLTFSSNPPLDQADILSLIIFNQPINQLGEGQQVSLAQRAGALASGYLTAGLARSIGNALDLDEFEIQAQGEGGAGPSVSVGEQVGRNLFFRVRQGFGADQATELILEYQIAEFLRLQTSFSEGAAQRVRFRRVERGGLDLIFFFSY